MSRFHQVSRIFSLGAIGAAAAIGFTALAATPASAGEWCHLVVGPVGPNGEAGEEANICEPTPGGPSPYAVQDKYTAIAVSNSTLASGSSWQYDTRAAAEQEALRQCHQRANDCHVAAWGLNECLALAISRTDYAWGTDYDRNGARAQAKAVTLCRREGGQSCVVIADPCSHD